MDERGKIELARAILVNAVNINMDKEVIQKLSEELDKYILEYYQNGKKTGLPIRGKKWE
ncbi:MAG: Spo0E family sporulation regulatory protein-aspartic acid phosphatase [Syntrophomonadaceae bacterium]|nr:Spo0E family sporulation regulatory protein-aspartic acid phosphatase [Syntrophomonadaceae bacterium]